MTHTYETGPENIINLSLGDYYLQNAPNFTSLTKCKLLSLPGEATEAYYFQRKAKTKF